MGYQTSWTASSLAECVGVSESQIWEWFEDGKLRGEIDTDSFIPGRWLHLPLIESLAAQALRDGTDPDEARSFVIDRLSERFVHTPDRKTPEELEDSVDRGRLALRLPPPDRQTWGDGDPRKERE